MQELNNLLDEIKTLLPKIHGWCVFEKAKKLVEIITEIQPELCVEIGVFGGSSLIPQAMALKHNKKGIIYGIDPWETDAALDEMLGNENKQWWASIDLENIYNHCQIHLKTLDLTNCHLIKDKSENVVNQFEDNSIDLLHIDGNHSEVHSYRDAVLYLPKVKSGGLILFDDIFWVENDSQVTTRKAIMYLLENCKQTEVVNDCLIMRKT